jgi:hypothetical protein
MAIHAGWGPRDGTVEQARDGYLSANGWTLEAYDARWTEASFFGIPFKVPNTARHRWGIKLHDLHHVATGFGTDLVGEGEVSVFELRGGLKDLGPYVASLVIAGALLAALIAPRRALAAWKNAAGTQNLFRRGQVPEALLPISVAEFRARLGLPTDGIAVAPPKVHSRANRRNFSGAADH